MIQGDVPVAYRIHIGDTDFFYHPECLDEADRRNVNHLTPAEQENVKRAYTAVTSWEMIPDRMICNYPECWLPIGTRSPFYRK